MRYGVLADVHANLPALERVLSWLEDRGVDRYLIAGDLVGYGPFPNECVDIVRGLDAITVAGNHDLIAVGRLPATRANSIARATLSWTAGVLRDDVRAYLDTLPLQAELRGGVVLAHGSLHDPEQHVMNVAQAARELAQLEEDRPEARVLVLGHVHRALAYRAGGQLRRRPASVTLDSGRWLVNPGAIGHSRDLRVRARFAVLDLDGQTVSFHSLSYDASPCRREAGRLGLPVGAHHRKPSVRKGLRRRLRLSRSRGRPR